MRIRLLIQSFVVSSQPMPLHRPYVASVAYIAQRAKSSLPHNIRYLVTNRPCSINLVLIDKSDDLTEATTLGGDFILHEIEAHGEERHSDEHIEGGADHSPPIALRLKPR